MSDVIKKIKTSSGDLPIDYTALANKPHWNICAFNNIIGSSGLTLTKNTPVEFDLSELLTEEADNYLVLLTITYNSLSTAKSNVSVYATGGQSGCGRLLISASNQDNDSVIQFFPMLIGSDKKIIIESSNSDGKATFFRMYAWTVV